MPSNAPSASRRSSTTTAPSSATASAIHADFVSNTFYVSRLRGSVHRTTRTGRLRRWRGHRPDPPVRPARQLLRVGHDGPPSTPGLLVFQRRRRRSPPGVVLLVRIGLHSGEAHERDGDYFGPAVNRAARVMDAANGSQILMSGATREILGHELPVPGTPVDLGVHDLATSSVRFASTDSTVRGSAVIHDRRGPAAPGRQPARGAASAPRARRRDRHDRRQSRGEQGRHAHRRRWRGEDTPGHRGGPHRAPRDGLMASGSPRSRR